MLSTLESRDVLMQSIRAFFHSEGFLEVETPVRLRTPCMELHIDAEPAGDCFLRTSPELCHKKLLARGAQKIFEIGPCFRRGERGRLHHPEYTLLEWYRTHSDYNAMLADTQALITAVSKPWKKSLCPDAVGSEPWKIWTVAEAFEAFAGWNPVDEFDADRFDLDLVEKVEPALPKELPVVLKDYPAACCALARLKPDNPKVAERWELYLNGIEIANAYSELTDPVEQRARFEDWGAQRKALGRPVYELDEEFFQCLETMPPAGGCALGVDRLLMILAGASSIGDVLAFPQ